METMATNSSSVGEECCGGNNGGMFPAVGEQHFLLKI